MCQISSWTVLKTSRRCSQRPVRQLVSREHDILWLCRVNFFKSWNTNNDPIWYTCIWWHLRTPQTYRCSLNLSQSTWGESASGLIWFPPKPICQQDFCLGAKIHSQMRLTTQKHTYHHHHPQNSWSQIITGEKNSRWDFKTMVCPKVQNRLPVVCGFAPDFA